MGIECEFKKGRFEVGAGSIVRGLLWPSGRVAEALRELERLGLGR